MEQVKENNENTGAGNETQIQSVQFSQLDSFNTPDLKDEGKRNLNLILDISVPVSVELGHTTMLVKDILSLSQGSIVELDKMAGTPVDLLIRGKLLAQGEVVVVDENFGLKITNICGSEERIRNLG
ncbi:Flagellar motor switch protein FliN [Candidatus Brocadiaceae bacterium B188]|nr:flagellar motor switch protein FliN [Candidatus Brocadia sapporoensis]QQR67205.1 MAG: flagellar motor switch protein FliN [Candidatus Brocadia sp.]RZV56720.1 MAG: flagellar motor switch protein FliN [Candidatus Brocadia sp. BROELEC01]TWU54224.1 Flagellar motor switch protein FliN [Candidatus Brocadiaceae bacterium B188]